MSISRIKHEIQNPAYYWHRRYKPGPRLHRNALIVDQVLDGRSYADIAREHGVSRQRIREIFLRDRPGADEA